MSRRAVLAWGWLLALCTASAFCALGLWQYGRMQQKQQMLDAVTQALDARKPVSLAGGSAPARAHLYDWSAGEGGFADAPAVLLDNQQRDGRAGVRAYRLFLPRAPDASPLLVELGWLPLPGDRSLPRIEPIPGIMRIEGLLAPPPSHGIGAATAALQGDGTILATGLGAERLPGLLGRRALAPRILRLDPKLPLGYARDLEILPNTLPPERHLGYAVQWFALAAAVLVTALILTFRKPRRRP